MSYKFSHIILIFVVLNRDYDVHFQFLNENGELNCAFEEVLIEFCFLDEIIFLPSSYAILIVIRIAVIASSNCSLILNSVSIELRPLECAISFWWTSFSISLFSCFRFLTVSAIMSYLISNCSLAFMHTEKSDLAKVSETEVFVTGLQMIHYH